MSVLEQKLVSLQRCVARARQALLLADDSFRTDLNLQDAAVLNALRACEISLDLANMVIRTRRLGVPAESRDSFRTLMREGLLDEALSGRLQRMVGFRNLAVHRYRELDIAIVESVIRKDLDDLLDFGERIRMLLAGDDQAGRVGELTPLCLRRPRAPVAQPDRAPAF